MREKYLEFLRTYLNARPDYYENLDEIKRQVILVGATEEEFNFVINELVEKQKGKVVSYAPTTTPTAAEKNQLAQQKVANVVSYSQTTPPTPIEKPEEKNKKSVLSFVNPSYSSKKLLKTIIVLFFIIISITSAIFTYYHWFFVKVKSSTKITQSVAGKIVNQNQNQKQVETTDTSDSVMPKIYSTSTSIDIKKTFSYPASNVVLTKPLHGPNKEVFGFFPYWMLDNADQVNIDTVTTIALFGLESDEKGNIVTNSEGKIDGGWAMWNSPKLDKFISTLHNKKIKVVLTIKSFSNDNIEKLVSSDDAQRNFISNTINLVNAKSLDGLNLDFEYIGTPNPKVRDGFSRLVTNLYVEMKRQMSSSSLTIDTYVHSAAALRLFDLGVLESQCDAFVIMGYDFHTLSGGPGPIAPFEGELSIQGFLGTYLEKISPDKIILALPYYGYDWFTSGRGAGMLSYAQAAEDSKNYTISWSQTSQTPSYSYTDQTGASHVVYFENARSLGIKYDYVNKKALKGIGIWALGFDGLNKDLEQLIIDKFDSN